MGEVFTPEHYVHQILATFDEKMWADENVILFEPSVGHGNIAVPVLDKRIAALCKKYLKAGVEKPILHGIANAVNTFWAIDVCPMNVELARKRCIEVIVKYLLTIDFNIRQTKTQDFLAHVLCSLIWQMHENEALSALSDESEAPTRAALTRLGKQWIDSHKHRPLDFSLDWCEFYKQSFAGSTPPIMHQRALRFIRNSLEQGRGFDEFKFAKDAVQSLVDRHKNVRLGAA
jgi:hypothetical protein